MGNSEIDSSHPQIMQILFISDFRLAIGNRKSAMSSLPFKDLQGNYKAQDQPRAKNRHVHPIRRQ